MMNSRISSLFPLYFHRAVFYTTLAAVFVVFYHSAILHMVSKWATPEGSHGPLILGVSIYLLWINKEKIRHLDAEPALLSGGTLLAAGCFIYFAGIISSTMLVEVISMVPVMLGVILLFGGVHFFKIFLLPLGYLIFLTGLVEQLLGGLAIYLQQFAAWFAAFMFRLIGIPVYHDYTIIVLPHISLEVVRACSGIGHIIALFALAIPLSHLAQRTWPRKIVLVFSAFFIGIVANGLRIVMIGLFTMFFPEAGVHGPYETFQVSVIFFFGLILLLLFSSLLARRASHNSPQTKNEPIWNQPSQSGSTHPTGSLRGPPGVGAVRKNLYSWRHYSAFGIGGFIFVVTLLFVQFYTPKSVPLESPLHRIPSYIAGFIGTEIVGVDERLRPFPAHDELFRRYENDSGKMAIIYIGYFEIQNRQEKIIDYRRAWMHEESSKVSVSKGQNTFTVNKARLRTPGNTNDVYFWYSMNGKIIRSQYTGKVLTFLNAFFTRTNNAAVIVVSTPNSLEELNSFLFELVDNVQNHLSGQGAAVNKSHQ